MHFILAKTMKYFFVIALFFYAAVTHGQTNVAVFSPEEFFAIVKKYHPLAKQAAIGIQQAQAGILSARGGFDPLASNYLSQKSFNGTTYYRDVNPELVIPTWYGIDIITGVENVGGNRLDPSNTLGKSSYVGVNIPLVKNLVMDQRRADLLLARQYKQMAEVEQQAVLNNLLMDAVNAYWNWVQLYQVNVVIQNAINTNRKRFELVKKAYSYGEKPAIDTLESFTQLQSFIFLGNDYTLQVAQAALQLSAYLWKENEVPFYLPENVQPIAQEIVEKEIKDKPPVFVELLQNLPTTHPELLLYGQKLQALEIERKLKFQSLLPKVDFRYNHLGKGLNILNAGKPTPFFNENYNYGLKFEMPLFLSGGRGDYKRAKLKIAETEILQSNKSWELELKVKQYFNEFLNLQTQVALQADMYANYQRLVKAEETIFFNGESSLFLINSRENKALESLQKLVALQVKYYKTYYAIQWSAGQLGNFVP